MVKKEVLKRLNLKKNNKKIAEIKDIVKSPLLNYREKIRKIEKIIKIKRYDAYKPKKISGAFSDNFIEYQSNDYRDRSISIVRYLNNIREHLRKLIDNKKKMESGRFN